MSLSEVGARGDTKCQNFNSFFEERWMSPEETVFGKPFSRDVKFIFSEMKGCFANPFQRRLINIFSIYLHYLGGCIRQVKFYI